MIHVYTGEGKGKTTAAVGLALRAAGGGRPAVIIRFLKGNLPSGEVKALERFGRVRVYGFGSGRRLGPGETSPRDRGEAQRGWRKACGILKSRFSGVLVLDEINCVLAAGLLGPEEVADRIKRAGARMEVVLTGRDAPPEIMEAAEYVTEMKEVRHPYRGGVGARNGVEY